MLLFYTPGTCAMSELIFLEYLGKPYWLCRVEGNARRQEPFLAKVNPHGQVPAFITDQGRVLTENSAILLHLSDVNPKLNWGASPGSEERDELHYWLSYLDSSYHMAYGPLFKTQAFIENEAQFEKVKTAALKRVGSSLEYLNQHLQDRKHFALGRETLLDAYFYAMGRWGRMFFKLGQEYPAVEQFLARRESDPWVQTALRVEQGELTQGEHLSGHKSLDEAITLIKRPLVV